MQVEGYRVMSDESKLVLSQEQLELALECLYNRQEPAEELQHLHAVDWVALAYLLSCLLEEQQQQPLQ